MMDVIQALDNTLNVKKSLGTNIRKRNLFKNIGDDDNYFQEMENLVVKQLHNVVNDPENNTGSQLVNEYIYFLTNLNLSTLRNILVNFFSTICKDYKQEVEKSISTGNMNIKYLTNIWKKYIAITTKLHSILWYFNKRFVNNSNNMSFINIIRYFIFYKDVINQEYNGKYLLCHISDSIKSISPPEIFNIIDFFDIYRCFTNLKPIIKNDSLFNEQVDNIIIKKINECEHFCDNFAKFMDAHIRRMKPETRDDIYKLILKALYITKYIQDKDILHTYITKYLSFRLLSFSSDDIEFESNIIFKMTELYDSNFTNYMTKILDDIKISRYFNDKYQNSVIKIASEKYKRFTVDKEMLSKFNTNILKMFFWKNVNQDEVKFKIPIEADIYIEIFEKFYKNHFENRKLIWKFDMGDAIISFPGLDKKYKLHTSTLQMFVMMYLNEDELTAQQISDKSEMKYELVEFILNGFVQSGTVTKYKNKKEELVYKHNELFSYDRENVSLLRYMKGAPKANSVKKVVEQPKVLTFNDKCNEISKLVIIFLEGKEKVIDKELFKYLKTNLTFDFSINEINSLLVQFLSKGTLCRTKENHNIFYEINKNPIKILDDNNDDDDNEEDDVEDDDDDDDNEEDADDIFDNDDTIMEEVD